MSMRHRFVILSITVVTAAAFTYPLSAPMTAQTPAAGTQSYVPPRTADGQPDLQGVWRAWNLAKYDLEDHGAKPGVPAGRGFVVDPPDGKIPYKPWAIEPRRKNYEGTKTFDPAKNPDPLAKCFLPGVPRLTYLGWPLQIVQTPQQVSIYYEFSHRRRFAAVGNVPVPSSEDMSNWLGVSRARFEGNSLVITVTNFNGYTWFDMAGNFHSDGLRVVERYTPTGPDTLQYEATMEDANVFTRPWTIRMSLQRQTDIGLLEYECTDMLDQMGVPHTWPRDFETHRGPEAR
jgi:hypothetical protein